MARKTDVGYRVGVYGVGVATLSYTPQADRGGIIRSINLANRSADDTWRLTVGGREIMAFRENASGNQQLLPMVAAGSSRSINFFDWCRAVLGLDPSVPVPFGLVATFKSDGGATAVITMEIEERDPGDLNPTMLNHYAGSTFLLPLIFQRAAAVPAAVVADASFDTLIRPAWMPNIVVATPVPANWAIDLLALFTEGGGVNTFSGAANHTSATAAIEAIRNGEFLFTHNAPDGLADVGNASAAGSANAVLTQAIAALPPFQQADLDQGNVLDLPLHLGMGDNLDLKLHFIAAGDTTGGADYSKFLQVAIAKVTRPSGV